MHWIPRLFGIIPLGIGLSVLFFLWTSAGFGSPPLIFRVFGSFVALGFVMFGGLAIAGPSLMKGHSGQLRNMMEDMAQTARNIDPGGRPPRRTDESKPEPKVGYDCPNCGASLGEDCDVSPSGDAKCQFCKRWFNIHTA